jgi:hypothetical protein
LTPAEVHETGKVLVEAMRRLDEVEDRRKIFNQQTKAEIGQIVATIETARNKVSSETEFRDVDCEVRFFFSRNGGEKDFVRLDTGEVVRTEKVSNEDRQGELGK